MKKNIFVTWLLLLMGTVSACAQYYNTQSDRTLYYEVYAGDIDKKHTEYSAIQQTTTRNDSIFITQNDFFPPISELINDSLLIQKIIYAKGTTIILLKDEESEKGNLIRMISSMMKEDKGDWRNRMVTQGSIRIALDDEKKKGEKIQTDKFVLQVDPLTITTTLNGEYQGFETVHTPAGDFNCLKIAYKMKTKFFLFSETIRVIEWYAKDVGLVKREECDDKQKTKTTKILSNMKRRL